MISQSSSKRVVITGMAVISPLGNSLASLWDGLITGRSGIRATEETLLGEIYAAAGMASDFTGSIDDFGPLDHDRKRAIRKGLKLMCREIQMGVAAAQLALHHAGLTESLVDPDRSGVVFGCDHIVTVPDEFADAIAACRGNDGFQFSAWGRKGLSEVAPLWLLKYLPNMPASHIAIYNDLRGPNNSLTYREASSNLAVGEGMENILRGRVDRTVVGATGSSVAPFRAAQLALNFPWARSEIAPSRLCRPFDQRRTGMVASEGAGALVLESFTAAEARGATIYGEVLGHGSSVVSNKDSVADIRQATSNVIRAALRRANLSPTDVGHVHAHGIGTIHGDYAEACGIADVLDSQVPVTTAKGSMGNLGAAGGAVELVASLIAIGQQRLFPIQTCEDPDPACPIRVANQQGLPAGDVVMNLNYTPHGQATAVVARGWKN